MISKDIYKWITGAFPVETFKNKEVKFPCPYCEHPNFYFNISKKIGFCHRDSCHRKPTLDDLIEIVGYGPELAGYVPEFDNREGKILPKVSLPPNCAPIKLRPDSWAEKALYWRGISMFQIRKYNIHSSKNQIIIPVYNENKDLVQYVGRFIDRTKPPLRGFNTGKRRYEYAEGVPITNYLFKSLKWDEELTLVENTFNAIWLDPIGEVNTNFGSHLSDTQVEIIKNSHVQQVLFLWDEGANSSKAIEKLKKIGVKASYFPIYKQPDDHQYEDLKETIWECHDEIRKNTYDPLTSEIRQYSHCSRSFPGLAK